ncbi:MAG: hypothetical protein ACI4T2_03350, partial [Christensenellales bacterium]
LLKKTRKKTACPLQFQISKRVNNKASLLAFFFWKLSGGCFEDQLSRTCVATKKDLLGLFVSCFVEVVQILPCACDIPHNLKKPFFISMNFV